MEQTVAAYAVAEFDFTATDTDELSFSAGDIIRVIAKHNDDWWEGEIDGKTGMFPRNRCTETTHIESHISEDNTRTPTPNTADISNQEEIKSGTSSNQPDAPRVSSAGGQWKQVTNPDGATYFYNTATQETLWDLPESKNTDNNLDVSRQQVEVRAVPKQKSLPPDNSTAANLEGNSIQGHEAVPESCQLPPAKSESPSPIETNGRTSRPPSVYSSSTPTTPPVIPSMSPAKQKRTSMLIAEVIPPTPDGGNDDDAGLDAGGITLVAPDGVDDEEDINSNPSGAYFKFDDEEGAMFDPLSMDYVKKEGGLNRKLEKLEGGKPASRQSWKMVYTALGGGYLLFFKDKISKLKKSDKMVRPLGCFDLQGVLLEQATKANTKKKNVFVLSAPSGEQLLFQADNEQDMNSWLEAIRQDRQKDSSMEPVAAVVGLIRRQQTERDSKAAKLKQFKGKGSNLQVLGSDDVDKSKEKKSKTRGKRVNSVASQASCNSDFSEDNQDKQKLKSKLGRFFSTRPTLDNLKEKGILAQESVFGGELDCHGRTVPEVVELCVSAVEKRGLDCVGIYRLSGNAASIQKLRFAFNQDEDVKLEKEQDVNVVAGVLKLYFRELSNPLMTFECYDMLIEAAKIQDYDSRMLAIQDLVHALPKPNFNTLQYLMEHLVRVAAKGDVNKMEPSNLAIVFGPTLMRPREETFKTICNTGVQNSVIESMILQCDWMFNKT